MAPDLPQAGTENDKEVTVRAMVSVIFGAFHLGRALAPNPSHSKRGTGELAIQSPDHLKRPVHPSDWNVGCGVGVGVGEWRLVPRKWSLLIHPSIGAANDASSNHASAPPRLLAHGGLSHP